ncbi:prepilin peptidase [Sphingomonas flavalba]|uniref:prepilin peptidase n=1 Tax=Sphingomonas flavalba TaxID=2559804 RepID=UPI00109D9423|nr:A24 family peptidase [Sphingomonas flavalba]
MTLLAALAGAGAGAIAGSFAATVVLRWPRGASVARGRSHCDGCGRTLGPVELIPLAGFALRGGRCRTCRAPIDLRHPAIEAAAAGIGALALGLAPDWATGAAGALFGWMLLTLAVLDLDHLWLPDRLTLPLAALGLGAGLIGIAPPLADRVAGLVVGFGSLWVVAEGYRLLRGRVGLGGGDPKLFGAIGAWLGWALLPWVLLAASVGGLAAVAVMAALGKRPGRATRLPFGTLLAAAAFALWLAVTAGALTLP